MQISFKISVHFYHPRLGLDAGGEEIAQCQADKRVTIRIASTVRQRAKTESRFELNGPSLDPLFASFE